MLTWRKKNSVYEPGKMKSIQAYLSFNGNCREAMTFYQQCLGGELHFQTIGASPLSKKMPAKMKKCILHAELKNENLVLYGSDMVSETGLFKGNAVSLVLKCTSVKETRACYKKLSHGGAKTYPLKSTYWNVLFGGLTDKYGNNWMLNCEKN